MEVYFTEITILFHTEINFYSTDEFSHLFLLSIQYSEFFRSDHFDVGTLICAFHWQNYNNGNY